MLIVFPSDPSAPQQPALQYSREYTGAKKAGFQTGFVGTEIQFGGDASLFSKTPPMVPGSSLYRGWLLKPTYYGILSDALQLLGAPLIVGAEAYRDCYEFPRWYKHIFTSTAKSISIAGAPQDFNIPYLASILAGTFGQSGVIVKDWIKSRKENWYDACYMPSAQDKAEVERVIGNFLAYMGETFTGGLVLREFRRYRKIGNHPKSGMPLSNEWRSFVAWGKVIYQCPYWDVDLTGISAPPSTSYVESAVQGIRSPFFAVDCAELEDGGWEIVEINVGESAGIPRYGDAETFYQCLWDASQTRAQAK